MELVIFWGMKCVKLLIVNALMITLYSNKQQTQCYEKVQ